MRTHGMMGRVGIPAPNGRRNPGVPLDGDPVSGDALGQFHPAFVQHIRQAPHNLR
jgi:hypothetical protein